MGLLDSALNAPMASFGDQEAWQALSMFLALNGWTLEPSPDEAAAMMLAVAAGELDERGLAIWLREHAEPMQGVTGASVQSWAGGNELGN